jgi:hypothetical protein
MRKKIALKKQKSQKTKRKVEAEWKRKGDENNHRNKNAHKKRKPSEPGFPLSS